MFVRFTFCVYGDLLPFSNFYFGLLRVQESGSDCIYLITYYLEIFEKFLIQQSWKLKSDSHPPKKFVLFASMKAL